MLLVVAELVVVKCFAVLRSHDGINLCLNKESPNVKSKSYG